MSAVDFERFRQNFADIIENLVGRQVDYTKLYPSVVTAQNADGTLQLIPDNKKVQGTGHNNIKIRHGLPGVSVEVSAGARVRLGFENGKPSEPYASLWDTDAAFVTIHLGDSSNTDFVALAQKTDDELTAVLGVMQNFIPVPNDGGAALKTAANATSLNSVAATKVNAE